LEAQIGALRAGYEGEGEELQKNILEMKSRERTAALQRAKIASMRKPDREGKRGDKK
jgi:hypothetical protein